MQGISYWQDSYDGIMFIFTADNYEGKLEWIDMDDLLKIKQFEQNEIFMPYLFKDELFEGKFIIDDKCRVLKHTIRKI